MSNNILGSANFGEMTLGNGSSHTNISAKFPLLNFAKPLWISDFNIEPPRVKIDPMAKQIVDKVCESLVNKPLRYKSRQRKDWTLKEIMKDEDKKGNDAKSKLIRDGHSATISEVSKDINRSNIDHTTKFLLSYEPIFVYALSFAIYYEKVKDTEGINDRVIAVTEGEIKSFFNVLLAKESIKQRHLDLSQEQIREIYKAASNTSISYVKGMPAGSISKIISKYVDQGNLHRLVDKFFESGEIDPAKGTAQIRQLMVNYLKEIGLIVKEHDEEIDRGLNFAEVESFEEEESAHTVGDSDEDTDKDYNQPS